MADLSARTEYLASLSKHQRMVDPIAADRGTLFQGLPVESREVVPPLSLDADAVLRVGASRVPLETIVLEFRWGATPEEIVQRYPAVGLDDVYVLIGYYLKHREELDAYLARTEAEAAALRREMEARFPPHGFRERLLARRATRD